MSGSTGDILLTIIAWLIIVYVIVCFMRGTSND